MIKDKDYLSKEKYQELENELADLKTTKRRAVAERLDFAKSMGDLSENAEYHAARDEQADIESRIVQLESILKSSTIISEHHSIKVEVGSSLVVKKKGSSEELNLKIVGSEEADINKGKISYQSPLGESLLGKKAGEAVTVNTPKGEIVYQIVKIN